MALSCSFWRFGCKENVLNDRFGTIQVDEAWLSRAGVFKILDNKRCICQNVKKKNDRNELFGGVESELGSNE
jgi:hypothetical protein